MTNLQKKALIILIATVVIKLLSINTGFFWDSVLLGARVGNYFFENGFSSWLIPVEMDSGHPPLFPYMLAAWWKIAGQSLVSSHLFMVPIVFGVLWQLHSLVSNFFEKQRDQILAVIIVVADPTLSSQLMLINPDLPQLFFFLLAINGMLKGKYFLMGLGLAFLGLISYRGIMLCAGILIVDFALNVLVNKKSLKSFFSISRMTTYIIGFLPAILYVVWRYVYIGWIVTSPLDPEFAGHYDIAQVSVIVRNLAVIAHRFADFGRIFLFIFVVGFLVKNFNKSDLKNYLPLTIIFLLSTSVIWFTSIFINNPLGHRYFIPSYIALGLLAYKMVLATKWPWVWHTLLVCALLSGNLWVYPYKIAQGWDSSLAHLSYWPARKQAISFMQESQIYPTNTGTYFPNITTNHLVMLDGNYEKFARFSGAEEYALYSNVFNLTDEEFDLLEQGYTPIKEFKNGRVKIILLKNREY